MRTWLACSAGRLVGLLLKVAGRAGTTVPGRVAGAVDPQFIANRRDRLTGPVGVVSATNGKTTTAGLLAAALGIDKAVVGNFAGANMAGGVASALVRVPRAEVSAGLFEVDEFWLEPVALPLRPDVVLLGNLFRDQLDRYGELDTILDRWHAAVEKLEAAGTEFVACADDPGIAWVLRDVNPDRITWYGCAAESVNIGSLPHAADSDSCRRCGEVLHYDAVYLGHLGSWICHSCGLKRPNLSVVLTQFDSRGARAISLTLEDETGPISLSLPLPGVYNAYNAMAAWTMAARLGCEPDATRKVFEATAAAFGRGEHLELDGADVQLLLVKNPTGANEVVRAVASEGGEITLQFILNDRIADGRDVSWIWDTDFEDLAAKVDLLICSGTRADEAALRFRYAGVAADRINVVPDARAGLRSAASHSDQVWVLPTYTAMLDLRATLTDEGVVEKVV